MSVSSQAIEQAPQRAAGSLRRFLPWNSVRGLIAVGLGLLILILASVTIAASWQAQRHQSELDKLQFHSNRALLIQRVETEAAVAGLLLQRYVDAGGDHYVEEINQHAAAAQTGLEEVLIMGGPPGFEQVVTTGLQLLQDAARTAQLRLIGEVERAREVLEDLVPTFREYRLTLEDLTEKELAEVEAGRQSADAAGQLTFWLLVASGAIGVVLGLAVSIQIARSIFTSLGSLERTARRASGGDLTARASETGPKEFAHLGAVLNVMMDGIEERTADLRQANAMLLKNNQELVAARNEAATDPLTGLGNHRSFHKSLRERVEAAAQTGAGVGLVIIDLDSFKDVNDTLGHVAGDQLLCDVASVLQQHARHDCTFRYGGDELAVLLPGKNHRASVDTAETLRTAITRVIGPNGRPITASLGVAALPHSASTPEELVYRADAAMYWAKSSGKNSVAEWNDSIAWDISTFGDARSIGPQDHLKSIAGDVVSSLRTSYPLKTDIPEPDPQ